MNAPVPTDGRMVAFDEKNAASYDERFAPLAAMTQALHLLMRGLWQELPEQARILCVGAGTGAEMMALAPHFPGWHFTAVDPSGPMLAICRRKAEAAGFAHRCSFHEGYLESLPRGEPFDAASCVLVSQFLLDREARISLFRDIASRLRPGGWMISADLAADLDRAPGSELLEQWMRLIRLTGASAEQCHQLRTAYRRDVSVVPPARIESILAEAGFARSLEIYHSLLLHAWASRVAPSSAAASRSR